jgi:hypothetical protein
MADDYTVDENAAVCNTISPNGMDTKPILGRFKYIAPG